ncbi:MAG TPA: LysR family transcriptional regulator [Ureibacillus sp.]|nr:LysR family transcriptional regulator [Ureibacillus sp.]
MDIEILKTFCTVSHYKSFKKAAEILNITQPGITKRIKTLEADLNCSLFTRTPQFVVLTKEGMEFLPYAERIVQISEEGIASINSDTFKKKLAIGGAPTTCFQILPEIVKKFIDETGVKVEIHTAPSSEIIDLLLDKIIDCGFTTTKIPLNFLEFKKVFTENFIFVKSINLHINLNSQIPIIVNLLNQTKNHPLEKINEIIHNDPRFNIICEVNYLMTSKMLIEKGVGVGILPYSDVKNEIEAGLFEEIRIDNFQLPPRPVYMVTYHNHRKSDIIKKFGDIISENLENGM